LASQVEISGNGKYVEVGSGVEVEKMQRRYIMNASVADFTQQSLVNVFNDQAAEMLGKTADLLHQIRVCFAIDVRMKAPASFPTFLRDITV
jgi:hypothetical protein